MSKEPFSALSDDVEYGLEARRHSPINRNWSWSPPVEGHTKIVHQVDFDDPRVTTGESMPIYEKIVADDSILFDDVQETETEGSSVKDEQVPYHPVTAPRGGELMQEMGFQELKEGEVLWQ